MNELTLDLHIHSKYSRAVSSQMNVEHMYIWGRKKGIHILSAADFTHPVWFREISKELEETSSGIYRLKRETQIQPALGRLLEFDSFGPRFMLSVEVSNIYSEQGKTYRIHNLIFAPNLETAGKINSAFLKQGFNLSSDGRPIFGITAKQLCQMLFEIDKKIAVIPCHIWTPWFSLYGSRSGYDRITDCFGEYSKFIFAVETGLSSDPSNNWRIDELGKKSIVSFSDAHSMQKMGREATVLRKISTSKSQTPDKLKINPDDITYENILNSFVRGHERVFEINHTIEFFPEEGKYHFTGHRNCNYKQTPSQTKQMGSTCPKCGRELTVGVMHRIEELSDHPENIFSYQTDENGVVWVIEPKGLRPKFVNIVPLLEVLAEALRSSVSSQKTTGLYEGLVNRFGSEFEVLLRAEIRLIKDVGGVRVAEAIEKLRKRDIKIDPGYDGEFGKVSIWQEEEKAEMSQETLF